jgi:hypothetical protein
MSYRNEVKKRKNKRVLESQAKPSKNINQSRRETPNHFYPPLKTNAKEEKPRATNSFPDALPFQVK